MCVCLGWGWKDKWEMKHSKQLVKTEEKSGVYLFTVFKLRTETVLATARFD